MSVSSVETFSGAIASSGTATPTITTSLVSTDRLVVHVLKSGTSGVPAVSGLGTWTTLQSTTLTRDSYIFTATGITGGGVVTVSPGAQTADYALYVLRGSGGGQVDVFGSEIMRSSSGGTTTAADINSALTGMFVCASASVDSGQGCVLPGASMLPSSGWTTTRTATNVDGKFIHQTLASGTTVRANATATAGSVIVMVGVFSEAGGPPALSSSFVGWGHPIF